MRKYNFIDFCSKQHLSKRDVQEFKAWLEREAEDEKFEHEWLRLFVKWVHSR